MAPIIEGTSRLKSIVAEYDFAVDGGAVSSITLRASDSIGNAVPNGAVVTGGYIEVDTALTGVGASVAVTLEGAGDLQAAAAISGAPWSTTGRKSITPAFTGASSVKTTAARSVVAVISGAVLTAGKFRVVVFYR
jgi:hypothetical protein